MAWVPAAIAAAGQIGGSLLGKKKSSGGGAYAPSIQTSPLFQQMQLLSMLGLGQQVSLQQLYNAGPLGTLLSHAQEIGGISRDQARSLSMIMPQLQRAISEGIDQGLTADQIAQGFKSLPFWKGGGGKTKNPLADTAASIGGVSLADPLGIFDSKDSTTKGRGVTILKQLLSQAGFGSFEDLVKAEIDYRQQASQQLDKYNQTASNTEQGRLDALNKIAGLQSGFISPTQDQLTSQIASVEAALRGQISREAQDQNNALLTAAQVGRYNPGGGMGRIGEWQAQANLEAGPDAVARALQLLSGQQGLQTSALAALQGSLNNADSSALQLLGLQSGNQLGIAGINSNQAMQNAALAAQGQQALGNSVGTGVGGIANALTLQQLLKQFPSTTGTTTKGASLGPA